MKRLNKNIKNFDKTLRMVQKTFAMVESLSKPLNYCHPEALEGDSLC